MNKIQFVFSVIIIATITLVSCGKDVKDPDFTDPHELLYDKWWYSIDNQGRGAHYFNSDGTCQFTIPPASGIWKWNANDSLIVTINAFPRIVLHFSELKEDTMEYWPTYEPEGVLYKFSTTEP